MAKKILVIDDSRAIRQSLMVALSKEGYEVIEAENGIHALELMKTNPIGLFISDVNMPEMDGITFLKKIKEDRDNRHTPVIMLTTESDTAMIDAGKEAGARAWMTKPFKNDELVAAVKKLFIM